MKINKYVVWRAGIRFSRMACSSEIGYKVMEYI